MKKIAQTMIVADCYYTIANANGKVIEAVEGAENGGAIQLATSTKAENQQWMFLRMGEGVYRIQNRGTGKMMDLMMNGTVDGTWLHQWEDVNGSSQLWIVEAVNDGTVKIKAQLAPTKCIDVVGMSNEDGAHIQIWEDVNGDNQKWTIDEVKERKAATKKEIEKKTAAKKTATKKAAEKKVEEVKAEEPAKAEAPKAEAKVEEVKAESAAAVEEPKTVAAAPAKTKAKASGKKKSSKKKKK